MAKAVKTTKPDEAAITNKLAGMVKEAVKYSTTAIGNRQEVALKLYNRAALEGDNELKSGRSKYVYGLVMEHVDWAVANTAKVFDTSDRVVEFLPSGPEDEPLAKQQTAVANFIATSKNSHVAFLEPWLKNGFITGLGIVMVEYVSGVKELLPELIKGVTDEQLIQYVQDEKDGKIIIEETGETYSLPLPPGLEQLIQQQGLPPEALEQAKQFIPMGRDLKIRRIRRQRQMNIKNLRPEDFIVSKDAAFDQQTGGISAKLQGHRRLVDRQSLIEQGFDKAKVKKIPSASDDNSGIAVERSRNTDYDQGVSDIEDQVWVYEIFTYMKLTGDKRRHYRITLAGDLDTAPVMLDHSETSEYYPYAAFCPYPLPNTLFGHGIADRIGGDQRILSQLQRGVLDSLHGAIHPIRVVNPDVVAMDDALNIHPGATVRSIDPSGGITFNAQPFAGAAALPVIEQIKQISEYNTGVGGSMIAVNASDLQNTTATGVSQRANSAQLIVEMICRTFADQGYKYLFRIIIDLLVQHPEDAEAMIKRLTNQYHPIRVDEWDPDYDITATIAFGVMNKEFNAASLQMILNQQMQIMQMPNSFVNPSHIYNTLTKIAENAGFKNAGAFFADPSTLPPPPPPAPPVDPNAGLIEIEKVKAQLKAQADDQKAQIDLLKFRVDTDRKQDEMTQNLWLKMAELEAKYNAQVNIARIQQEQAAQRNDVDLAIAAQAEQQKAMAEQAQRQQELAQQQQQAMQMPPQPEPQVSPEQAMLEQLMRGQQE
ncbi:hypothetical protein FHR76_002206 [Rhizobium sp. RAS22]|nr:hypothetical protein [Rhizobium sp. RAS22]